jgi:hypothetical protein
VTPVAKPAESRPAARKERRRPDPQVIGLAHSLGYGRDAATVAALLRSVARERRAAILTLLAGGAIS